MAKIMATSYLITTLFEFKKKQEPDN